MLSVGSVCTVTMGATGRLRVVLSESSFVAVGSSADQAQGLHDHPKLSVPFRNDGGTHISVQIDPNQKLRYTLYPAKVPKA